MDAARALGAKFGSVELVEIQDSALGLAAASANRGLFATEDLSAGATVVEVPTSACLDAAGARSQLPSWGEDLSDEAALGLWLALMRKEAELPAAQQSSGPRVAYAASLPQEATSLQWADEELAILEGSSFHEAARSYREETDMEWSYLSESPDASAWTAERKLSAADLRWGKSAVSSRQLQLAGAEQPCVVTPGFDLLNHSNEPNAELSLVELNGVSTLVVKTVSEVKKGHEVLICYGPHANASLLMFYGFALPLPNPHDCMEVLLRLPATAARVAAVKALAARFGESEVFQVISAEDGAEEVMTRHCLFKHRPLAMEMVAVFSLQLGEGDLTAEQDKAARVSLRRFLERMVADRAARGTQEDQEGIRGALARVRRAEREILEASIESVDALIAAGQGLGAVP
eukprot:TRINITY_DN122337_c0_g1_i1.p1 TRINITY_DN122337_c0_g1~~TRINITY_DN122337_c0_g1_i1.p1  ORF type:complete len:428 (+),score=89.52 TRINITY_DN122337_c0_g1_i1:74-1285(+)